jgi:hypothetical protein
MLYLAMVWAKSQVPEHAFAPHDSVADNWRKAHAAGSEMWKPRAAACQWLLFNSQQGKLPGIKP